MKTQTINKLPEDGYLILPISMARISHGQSPEVCYQVLEYFEKKLSSYGLDVVILYTDGLYFNSSLPAHQIRRASNEKVVSHKNRLQSIIEKNKKFMPQAIHYLPWDYAVINSDNFQGAFNVLRQAYDGNEDLKNAVREDLDNRDESIEHVNFILEEVVMTHLIRQKFVSLPKTLVREDNFRVVVYPGQYLRADKLQYEKRILPCSKKLGKRGYPYASAHYNFDEKLLYNFCGDV